MNVKVFVSSTWEDLQAERDAVEQAVDRMARLEFSGMEHFGSSPRSARDESLERVDRADIYVGIFGGRYGSGITEEEYRRARTRNLPCLLYFKAEASIPPEQRDSDPDQAAKRAAFYTELRDSRNGHLASEFSSPDQLATKVAADLHNWLFERYLRAFVRGTAKLPTDYAARFRNYFVEYLGTPERPVPFGGREGTLAELDAWLADGTAPPYLLLTAGAGRGKSALLVHWARRLLSREDIAVVHLPVSIRFRTNLGAVVFASLAAQLAAYNSEEVPTDLRSSVEVWRGLVSDYLHRPVPDGKRLVVILDGLDEAADWQAGADLFPRLPPPGLRLVVSARHTSEAPDAETWRRRLGWEDPALARALDLDPLDSAGVADVLQRMGFPLDELSRRVDIVSELHRLSGGDPLLVNLYVKDLWARGQEAARLRPEDLQGLRPGLEGYFDRWWQDQRELWGKESPLREKSVQTLLSLLTCALGPLTRDDLLAVAPEDSGLSSWTIEDALRPLSRFIAGDGEESGYVFNHPRFSLYLYAKLSEAERRAWDARFIAWGKDVLARLASSQLAPADAPDYLVQYLGSHLERAKAKPEDFLESICPAWRDAWLALEGGYSGFISDVDRAWRVVAELDRQTAEQGRLLPHLKDEIFLALCRASVVSLAANLPPVLLERVVEEGLWTPRQALAYARQMPRVSQRAEALGRTTRHLPAPLRDAVSREAVEAALAAQDPEEKVEALGKLLVLVEPPPVLLFLDAIGQLREDILFGNALLDAALRLVELGETDAAVRTVRTVVSWPTDSDLLKLALRLCDLNRLPEVERVAAAASEPQPFWSSVLTHLAAKGTACEIVFALDRAPREGPLQSLLETALRLRTQPGSLLLGAGNEQWMFHLVSGGIAAEQDDIVAFLQEIRSHMEPALISRLARCVQEEPTVWGLVHLATLVPPGDCEAVVAQALATISSEKPWFKKGQALAVLASALTPATLDSALNAVRFIDYETKAPAVREIALTRIREGDPNGAAACLEAFSEIDEPFAVLAALWDLLPEKMRTRKCREQISETQLNLDSEGFQELCRKLSGSLLQEIVLTRSTIRDTPARVMLRFALADREAGDPLPALFHVASEPLSRDLFEALSAILPIASPRAFLQITGRILEEIEQQGSPEPWLLLLARSSKLLPEPQRSEMRQWVWKILLQMRQIDPDLLKISSKLENSVPEDLRERVANWLRGFLTAEQFIWMWPWTLQLLPGGPREESARELVRFVQRGGGSLESIRLSLDFLPEQERRALLPQWLHWKFEDRIAESLVVLAPHLGSGQLQEALQAARKIESRGDRALAILGLLPYLPVSDRAAALEEDLSIDTWEKDFEGRLTSGLFADEQVDGIVRIFEEELTPSGFEAVAQEAADSVLLPRLSVVARSFDRPLLCRIVQHALRPDRICDRPRLFRELAGLSPVLIALGGEAQIPEIEAAIDAVCELFP